MNLKKLMRKGFWAIRGWDDMPGDAIREQVIETARTMLLYHEELVEDCIDDLEDEPEYETAEEFKPEYLFAELTREVLFMDARHQYEVTEFGMQGDESFCLRRIMVTHGGNPMGCFFLGDSTDIVGEAGEFYARGEYDGLMPEGLKEAAFFVGFNWEHVAPEGVTVEEWAREHPEHLEYAPVIAKLLAS